MLRQDRQEALQHVGSVRPIGEYMGQVYIAPVVQLPFELTLPLYLLNGHWGAFA